MSKFKIGDKVKVVKYVYDGFPIGSMGEVVNFRQNGYSAVYYVSVDGFTGRPLYEDELELVS